MPGDGIRGVSGVLFGDPQYLRADSEQPMGQGRLRLRHVDALGVW
jgi:hypothetical protein